MCKEARAYPLKCHVQNKLMLAAGRHDHIPSITCIALLLLESQCLTATQLLQEPLLA